MKSCLICNLPLNPNAGWNTCLAHRNARTMDAPSGLSPKAPLADLENLLNFLSHQKEEVLNLCINPGRLEEVIKSLSDFVITSKAKTLSDRREIAAPTGQPQDGGQ